MPNFINVSRKFSHSCPETKAWRPAARPPAGRTSFFPTNYNTREQFLPRVKTLTSQLSGPLIRSNGLCLCKISSLMSQFSTNKRTFSVFRCCQFAVFNNCWSTTLRFSFNYYMKQWHKYQTITLIPSFSLNCKTI